MELAPPSPAYNGFRNSETLDAIAERVVRSYRWTSSIPGVTDDKFLGLGQAEKESRLQSTSDHVIALSVVCAQLLQEVVIASRLRSHVQ